MKYELHVNDTFETKEGVKGFIARIKPYNNYQIITIRTYTGWYYTFAIPLGEFDGYDDMPNIFKHIGAYNFSKSDEIEKIELLSFDYRDNDIVDTINEIIEVVNELRGETEMKYEFHVGDYVEMKDGKVGYIKDILPATKLEPTYLCCIMDSKDSVLYPIHSFDSCDSSYNMLLKKYFNRIGQYDFTKKDEGKIEFIDGVDTTNPIDSPFIIDKINELIEAVNELKEKVYEFR